MLREFTELFDDSYDALLLFALKRLGSPQDAEDTVNSAFLVAYERLAAGESVARPWLFGVARNLIAAEHRRQGAATRLAAELTVHARAVAEPASVEGIALRDAVADLPERDRALATLIYWQGLSTAEAAAQLGMSGAAVRTRLLRLRRRLRARLDPGSVRPLAPEDRAAAGKLNGF